LHYYYYESFEENTNSEEKINKSIILEYEIIKLLKDVHSDNK
jgi:hypothetical protein